MRWFVLLCLAASLPAAVTKVHLVDRIDVLEGKSFGAAGPYERIRARANYALDPKLEANKIIKDLDLAKRNEKGLVEFSADIFVLKPRDPAKGNGSILFEVSNRGGRGLLGMFQQGNGTSPESDPKAYGDAWLMEQGYTLVWVGWQWDVPNTPGNLRVYPPIAEGVEALIRSELVPHTKVTKMNLGDRNMISYPATGKVSLLVRDSRDGKRKEIPTGWSLTPDKMGLEMPAGFAAYQIYEAVYTSKNPPVVGTGMAAIRDFISFLKFEDRGDTLLGDQRAHLKRALAFGTSQSGRFLRTFLYEGFNTDEKGRKVFEGIWANVGGAGRGSFNFRGAQPSRDGHPTFNHFYQSDLFPFTDVEQTDPETGKQDGLLARVKDAPKIFYTNGSYEYWGRNAALIHVTPDGKADAPIAPTTRIFYVAGSQHGPGRTPPPKNGVNAANMNDYRPLYRALLVSLHDWVRDGKEPPASRYPRLDRSELATPEQVKLAGTPKQPMRAWRMDYTSEPPKTGKPFPILVPQVDADGNEMGGVKMPEVAAPLATYTGWNYLDDPNAPKGWVNDMVGSTLPFAKDKINGRYTSREAYLGMVRVKARDMVKDRLLLERDVEEVINRAGRSWDWVMTGK